MARVTDVAGTPVTSNLKGPAFRNGGSTPQRNVSNYLPIDTT